MTEIEKKALEPAKDLTPEQCDLIRAANAWFENKLLVSAKDARKLEMWNTGLTEMHNFSCDALTETGLAVHGNLKGQSDDRG